MHHGEQWELMPDSVRPPPKTAATGKSTLLKLGIALSQLIRFLAPTRNPNIKLSGAGLPDFSRSKHTKTGKICQITTNYTKLPYNTYTKWP
jgi:hypothetical protein